MPIKQSDSYDIFDIPLTNMSFTPDVAASALSPTEYSSGLNVEVGVRGIKKVNGEQDILGAFTDPLIYVDAGFRAEGQFVYIVATLNASNQAKWFLMDMAGNISNITPGVGGNPNVFLTGYTTDTPITGSWIGNAFVVNDTIRAPMYLKSTATGTLSL